MNLILRVKKQWFDQIKAGTKREEYRLVTAYWRKRLEGRAYDQITITLGYPKRDDQSRRLVFPWRGCHIDSIYHEEWGNELRQVFVIRLELNRE